jgi:hypothetical protein
MIWVWRATVEWHIDGENRRNWRKSCPSATLSTTNATWIDLGANPGLRSERPVTNGLRHGTAYSFSYFHYNSLFHDTFSNCGFLSRIHIHIIHVLSNWITPLPHLGPSLDGPHWQIPYYLIEDLLIWSLTQRCFERNYLICTYLKYSSNKRWLHVTSLAERLFWVAEVKVVEM